MSMHFAKLAEHVRADGVITAAEVMELRGLCWTDNHISQDEAEAIFAANGALTQRTAEWCDFFVEALGEYTVNQMPPRGYVSDTNAQWLMTQLDHDGHFGSMAECELLVRVFEIARNVPEALKLFAIERIEHAVLTGEGPTRCGGALEAGNVTAAEANILRRAIFAPSSERPAAVSAKEAEMLFRLKDATLAAANDPAWKRLFVQGVANFLMGYSSANAQLTRERAVQLHAAMDDNTGSIASFLSRAMHAAPNLAENLRHAHKALSGGSERNQAKAREDKRTEDQAITDSESEWLDERIASDGRIDEYEQALLDFLAEEASDY